MTWRRILLVFIVLVVTAAVVAGWINYRRLRDDYDAYQTLIQPGLTIAGVDVGGLTPEQARALVESTVAQPYYRDFALSYQGETLALSPVDDLGFRVPVEEMVGEAVAASHQYDYWQGFLRWIQDDAVTSDLEIPLRMEYDISAAEQVLAGVAQTHDVKPLEPMVDIQNRMFIPGSPGRQLNVAESASRVNAQVTDPEQRTVDLPVTIIEPDHDPERIESMLRTLVPVMEQAPTVPSFYTATVPLSTTGGIEGTPFITYTGELTWTFPQFAGYSGPLTSTTGFFFAPGEPGYTFNVESAMRRVALALSEGETEPITFEPDLVPPQPISPSLLIPPLEARLAEFPGVTSILVKNLDSGELVYKSNADLVLSGMSIVKIGIMVEVYRYFGGEVDDQTHKELVDMLGSESCNPCANRLLTTVGGGSAKKGAQRVTATMNRLGLSNFYLCSPFRVVELWEDDSSVVWTAYTSSLSSNESWFTQSATPRYDNCVRATPSEMAELLEMIYDCTQDSGLLREMYPEMMAPAVCEEMIDIMAANDLRNMLGAGIPDEVKLAHKHGFSGYDVPWGDTRGEVGIVYSPGVPWLISFYIWQDTPWINWGINQPLYRDVSNMLYNYFNPEQPYWPRPPWAPDPEEESQDSGT